MTRPTELNQFDVVRLLHTKNVKYLSGPPGRPTAPKGEWTVVGFMERDALLAKQSTIIRVPLTDITIVASYAVSALMRSIKQTGTPKIDVANAVSKHFNIPYDRAVELCRKHKVPIRVDSKLYEQKAIEKLEKLLTKKEKENGQG